MLQKFHIESFLFNIYNQRNIPTHIIAYLHTLILWFSSKEKNVNGVYFFDVRINNSTILNYVNYLYMKTIHCVISYDLCIKTETKFLKFYQILKIYGKFYSLSFDIVSRLHLSVHLIVPSPTSGQLDLKPTNTHSSVHMNR